MNSAASAIFRIPALVFVVLSSTVIQAADLQVIPTFESAGLYWKPAVGSADTPCSVRFRRSQSAEWQQGFPLWFDDRTHQWGGEYRGSLVHLQPGTRYEVQVQAGDQTAQAEFQSWNETFPIGTTHTVPPTSDQPLIIRTSGTPDAWALYEPQQSTATIDVGNRSENCIRIEDASHVIIRGLTLRSAATHAIELVGNVHDIVIEGCDISGWGRIESDGWGRNYDSAVFSRSRQAHRIIVQDNLIHHPTGDSNNWNEHRPTPRDPDNYHPGGPQAVFLAESMGNHVLRYNTVFSDDSHQFNDIFGAAANYSTIGFPHCDSDIYGNRLSHCWDDAIESEGANRNVRIWGNYIEKTMIHVATATTSVGPLYIWRNIAAETRRSDKDDADQVQRGGFMKTSDRMGGGRIYVFHNTLLQPPAPPGFRNTLGAQIGMGSGGAMLNTVSRNNIFHTSAKGGPFNDRTGDPLGDYDYDLYNGRLLLPRHEQHAVVGVPRYDAAATSDPASLPFSLTADSPGIDAGQRLPGFNDRFTAAAPDIGAHERQTPLPVFGSRRHSPGSFRR